MTNANTWSNKVGGKGSSFVSWPQFVEVTPSVLGDNIYILLMNVQAKYLPQNSVMSNRVLDIFVMYRQIYNLHICTILGMRLVSKILYHQTLDWIFWCSPSKNRSLSADPAGRFWRLIGWARSLTNDPLTLTMDIIWIWTYDNGAPTTTSWGEC